MDSINRQDAIDAVERTGLNEDEKDTVIRVIENLPSAERKGKWIRHDEIKNAYGGICIECSECGEKYVVQHIEDEKYCRNCGARMESEE